MGWARAVADCMLRVYHEMVGRWTPIRTLRAMESKVSYKPLSSLLECATPYLKEFQNFLVEYCSINKYYVIFK